MCSHCLRASCSLFYGGTGPRGQPGVNPYRDCAEIVTDIVQYQFSCRPVSAATARKSYGARAGIGFRTLPVRGLCNTTYDICTGYGLTIFPNL